MPKPNRKGAYNRPKRPRRNVYPVRGDEEPPENWEEFRVANQENVPLRIEKARQDRPENLPYNPHRSCRPLLDEYLLKHKYIFVENGISLIELDQEDYLIAPNLVKKAESNYEIDTTQVRYLRENDCFVVYQRGVQKKRLDLQLLDESINDQKIEVMGSGYAGDDLFQALIQETIQEEVGQNIGDVGQNRVTEDDRIVEVIGGNQLVERDNLRRKFRMENYQGRKSSQMRSVKFYLSKGIEYWEVENPNVYQIGVDCLVIFGKPVAKLMPIQGYFKQQTKIGVLMPPPNPNYKCAIRLGGGRRDPHRVYWDQSGDSWDQREVDQYRERMAQKEVEANREEKEKTFNQTKKNEFGGDRKKKMATRMVGGERNKK